MTCRWNDEARDYLVDGQPCRVDNYGDPTKHCTARPTCSVHIGRDELTCPRCIARTRANLRRIPTLAALVVPVAVASGVNSEAANLAGPAADPEAWTWRKVAARQGRSWHLSLIEDDDEQHPYSVLGRWDMMIREDYDHPSGRPVTITNAADYLDRQLARIANDPGQDWPLFAAEIRRCRRHLEQVIALTARPERGAPCPDCTSEETGVGPRLVRKFPHWCDDPECEQVHYDQRWDRDMQTFVPDHSGDVWQCPRDREHVWSHEDYTRWIEERRAG